MARTLDQGGFVGGLRRPRQLDANASRSTLARNACGVCARKMPCREAAYPPRIVARPPASRCRWRGSAAIAAPCAAAASIVRAMSALLTSGRAASWMTTMSAAGGHTRKRTRDGILPSISAFDDLDWFRAVAEIRGRVGGKLGGKRDDRGP